MKLFNSLTRKTEEFEPIDSKKVKLYTCGLTVYSQPHIGNWVAYIYWDILVRALQASGFEVERVQNITDVGHLTSDEDAGEDKMLKSALKEGKTAWQVAEKYMQIADYEAFDLLKLLKPEYMPRATDYIKQQIEFVQELEKKGYTYVIDDGVYFDTSKLKDYGKLAQLDIDGLQFGARVEDTGKKNPTDFAVWKFSPKNQKRDMEWWAPWSNESNDEKNTVGETRASYSSAMQDADEQQTEPYSKYGEGVAQAATKQSAESISSVASSASHTADTVRGSWGFPGWHLECSVLAREALGDTIDIHTGGVDHIPVHHTNEIAQTESVTNKPFANFWIHANHIKVDGTKMSKSLGNIFTLQDILDEGYGLQAFKLLILSKHYSTEGNFTWEIMQSAQNRLNNWQAGADLRWQNINKSKSIDKKQILKSLQNNLDTPNALITIDTFFKNLQEQNAYPQLESLQIIQELLGINLIKDDINESLKMLIKQRSEARKLGDWELSDRLKDKLFSSGVAVKDTPNGTFWYRV